MELGITSKKSSAGSISKSKHKRRKTNSSSYGFRFDGDRFDNGIVEVEAIFSGILGGDEDIDGYGPDDGGEYGALITACSLLLGCSLLDLDTLCTKLLDLTGIRRSEWNSITLSTNCREEK